MRSLLDDLRFASRLFARRRTFSLLLVATVAIGIGSATAIFSLVDGVLWRPLPYRDVSRLYWIARTDESWRASPVLAHVWDNLGHTLPEYREWAGAQRSFDATGAWLATTAVLGTSEGVEQVAAGRASASLTTLLGVRPTLGRWFLPGEDDRGGAHVVVLSFETWQTRYGARTDIIGSRLSLNGTPFDVVGVLPAGFRVAGDTSRAELWTPAGSDAIDWTRNNFNFRVLGLLRAGVTPDAATREAARLLVDASRARTTGIRLENLQLETTRSSRAPLTVLLAAALLLLVIACGNAGSLLLGEMAARETEVATRLSLGASGTRIVRQIFTENALLAAVGGASGGTLAIAAVRVLRVVAPPSIPRIETAHVDGRGLAFAIGVTLLTALACSAAPLGRLLLASPASVLGAGASRVARQRSALERAGVLVQCILVVVLLAGATLLVRTHQRLLAVDPGFRASQIASVRLRLPSRDGRYRDAESRRGLLDAIVQQVGALPGVEAATAASGAPFQGASTTDVRVGDSPVVAPDEEVPGTYIVVEPGFFETMGVGRRAGRLFDATDNAPGTAAIVSEAFARRIWPNASAIGQRIRVDDRWREVVGVVADVRHRSMDEDVRTTFYLPAAQAPERPMDAFVLRTVGDPRLTLPAVRRIIARADPTIAVARADRLSDLVDATLVAERFRTLLVAVFAVTAVWLAAVGIVGVAANAVTRRTRELAIRMAVGAAPASMLRVVVSGTLTVAAVGALLGTVAALGAARALRPFLYGITPADPVTYVSVLTLVVLMAGVAAWLPARRVLRLDLMRTLMAP